FAFAGAAPFVLAASFAPAFALSFVAALPLSLTTASFVGAFFSAAAAACSASAASCSCAFASSSFCFVADSVFIASISSNTGLALGEQPALNPAALNLCATRTSPPGVEISISSLWFPLRLVEQNENT